METLTWWTKEVGGSREIHKGSYRNSCEHKQRAILVPRHERSLWRKMSPKERVMLISGGGPQSARVTCGEEAGNQYCHLTLLHSLNYYSYPLGEELNYPTGTKGRRP